MVNVSVKDRTREVIINADAGRARRPLLVVEDGEPRISDEEIEALREGDARFEDLVAVPIPGRGPLVVVTNPRLVHDALSRPAEFPRIAASGSAAMRRGRRSPPVCCELRW